MGWVVANETPNPKQELKKWADFLYCTIDTYETTVPTGKVLDEAKEWARLDVDSIISLFEIDPPER